MQTVYLFYLSQKWRIRKQNIRTHLILNDIKNLWRSCCNFN